MQYEEISRKLGEIEGRYTFEADKKSMDVLRRKLKTAFVKKDLLLKHDGMKMFLQFLQERVDILTKQLAWWGGDEDDRNLVVRERMVFMEILSFFRDADVIIKNAEIKVEEELKK